MIQSSSHTVQESHLNSGNNFMMPLVGAENSTPVRDVLHIGSESSGCRRMCITPHRTPSRAAERMTASSPTPMPFSVHAVAEREEPAVSEQTGSTADVLTQSGGWKVVSEECAATCLRNVDQTSGTDRPHHGVAESEPKGGGTEHEQSKPSQPPMGITSANSDKASSASGGAVWYMPDFTLSTPARPAASSPSAEGLNMCLFPIQRVSVEVIGDCPAVCSISHAAISSSSSSSSTVCYCV